MPARGAKSPNALRSARMSEADRGVRAHLRMLCGGSFCPEEYSSGARNGRVSAGLKKRGYLAATAGERQISTSVA